MPLGSKDNPKEPAKPADKDPEQQAQDAGAEAAQSAANPFASQDPNIPDDKYAELDPTKVVGTYAMQPDPNDDRPAPLPNIHPGVNEAPADDEPGTPAINKEGE